MTDCLTQYYRCPEKYIRFGQPTSDPSFKNGYFRFGKEAMCYGSYCNAQPTPSTFETLPDALQGVAVTGGTIELPFDPSQVVENLYYEKYASDWRQEKGLSSLARLYYLVRPALPVRVRKHLQKIYLKNWEKIPFPRWPVDSSVDDLLRQLLLLSIRSIHIEQIPFIWFWPEGAPSCGIMTHDVETEAGRDCCAVLMDMDDSFDIKSSFQVVPEERYVVDREFLSSIRSRGFEVVVHDLNHDGHLYKTREQFVERAHEINAYGKKYEADGFRAGVLYRKQLWYDALEFAYDMSVPNVAHLDPQRGGCCTVMPYFIGNILELPVTTIQDYTLFNILNEYSIDLWKRQIQLIMKKHGLMNFIIHPDYIATIRARSVYKDLLGYLANLRQEEGIWITTPGEVNRWWRQRAKMRLVECRNGWTIDGEGSERACIAYASERDGELIITSKDGSAIQNLTCKQ